jgi:hypothetical protein
VIGSRRLDEAWRGRYVASALRAPRDQWLGWLDVLTEVQAEFSAWVREASCTMPEPAAAAGAGASVA